MPLPESGERWLVGRKAIAAHLGIDPRTLGLWRERYRDLPILTVAGSMRANPAELDAWVKSKAENVCPMDRLPCHRATCCAV